MVEVVICSNDWLVRFSAVLGWFLLATLGLAPHLKTLERPFGLSEEKAYVCMYVCRGLSLTSSIHMYVCIAAEMLFLNRKKRVLLEF